MKSDENIKKVNELSSGEVDHLLLPKITNDEIDLEIDSKRDEEINRDKPPHHN
jgi:hypothetical protein